MNEGIKVSESFWDKQYEIDAKEEATDIRIIAYRILKADLKKRQVLEKMREFITIEGLLGDSMTYLVWDMLGLRKRDGEYFGDEHLGEWYYGKGGVIEGATKIDDYIDEIIRIVGLQNEQRIK